MTLVRAHVCSPWTRKSFMLPLNCAAAYQQLPLHTPHITTSSLICLSTHPTPHHVSKNLTSNTVKLTFTAYSTNRGMFSALSQPPISINHWGAVKWWSVTLGVMPRDSSESKMSRYLQCLAHTGKGRTPSNWGHATHDNSESKMSRYLTRCEHIQRFGPA